MAEIGVLPLDDAAANDGAPGVRFPGVLWLDDEADIVLGDDGSHSVASYVCEGKDQIVRRIGMVMRI